MNIDFAWFYSALPQSAAAIAGVIGAFIVARIINLKSIFTDEYNLFSQLVLDHHILSKKVNNFKTTIIQFNKDSIFLNRAILKDIEDDKINKYSNKQERINYVFNICPYLYYDEDIDVYLLEMQKHVETNRLTRILLNAKNNSRRDELKEERIIIENYKFDSVKVSNMFNFFSRKFKKLHREFLWLNIISWLLVLFLFPFVLVPLWILNLHIPKDIITNLLSHKIYCSSLLLIGFFIVSVIFIFFTSIFIILTLKKIKIYYKYIKKYKLEKIETISPYFKEFEVDENLL